MLKGYDELRDIYVGKKSERDFAIKEQEKLEIEEK